MAGVVCGPAALVDRLQTLRRITGPLLDPHAAFLLERGLKTMPLRVAAANASAQRVAEHLAGHRAVHAVHYPGLPSHPQHALARAQMPGGYGGVLSFDVATFAEAKRFLDGLRVVKNAASLGGVESLCSLPYQQSHRHQPREALAASGITEGTVRLALGVEDTEDLLRDVDGALASVGKA
jgi:cystathionine beta-lyase/cystathionine gamma-synthase